MRLALLAALLVGTLGMGSGCVVGAPRSRVIVRAPGPPVVRVIAPRPAVVVRGAVVVR